MSKVGGVFYYVSEYLKSRGDLSNKIIVDVPAGDGRACRVLKDLGAKVIALDIFPEFMQVPDVESKYADMAKELPIESGAVDLLVCQEGIEHVSDQLKTFHEFNRILKPSGEAIVTTPNITNLIGRFSTLVHEGELLRYLPPSEVDGIWFSDKGDDLYYGHIFLIGVQQLRNLGALSGFEISEIVRTGISRSSVLLSPFLYPVILIFSFLAFLKSYRRSRENVGARSVIAQQFRLNVSPTVLFSKHLFVVYRKLRDEEQTMKYLKSVTRQK